MNKISILIMLPVLFCGNTGSVQAQGLSDLVRSKHMNQKGIDNYLIKKLRDEPLYYSASVCQADNIFAKFTDPDVIVPKHVGFKFSKTYSSGDSPAGDGKIVPIVGSAVVAYPQLKKDDKESVVWDDGKEHCNPWVVADIRKDRFRGNYYYSSMLQNHNPYWGFQLNEDGSVYLVRIPPVANDAYDKIDNANNAAGWSKGIGMFDFDKIQVDALFKSEAEAKKFDLSSIKAVLKEKARKYIMEDDKQREKEGQQHMENARPDPPGMEMSPTLKKQITTMGQQTLSQILVLSTNMNMKGAKQLKAWCVSDDWTPVNNDLGIPEYHYIWTEHIFKTAQNNCYIYKIKAYQKYAGGGTYSGPLLPDKVELESQHLVQIKCEFAK